MMPHDSNILSALGVLQFLRRDFGKAAIFFHKAIKENPTDHTVWNKFGAALTNSMKIDDAKAAYKIALDLRPNYVRTLVNIGLSHSNGKDFKAAVQCFLNALALNPNATHIWRYVKENAIQGNMMDLIPAIDKQDLSLFQSQFPTISQENLPPPNMESLYSHPLFMS